MSRPKHYWYINVKRMLGHMKKFTGSPQEIDFVKAYKKAIDETRKMPDGELRIKCIEGVLVNHTMTVISASMEVGYSERTVQGWINRFVNTVGKYDGYKDDLA